MESNSGTAQSDLLIKLNRLEDQVSTLTMQLELNKETIAFLKTTLAERDAYIGDLEIKLAAAQKELEKSTLDKIYDLRYQIKSGIDEKLVRPVLGEIRRNIDQLQGFVDQTREVIRQKQRLLRENTQATVNLIQRSPDRAIRYFEHTILEPTRFAMHHISQQTAIRYAAVVQQLQEEVLKPGVRNYERLTHFARELPSDISVLFQMRVVEPLLSFINAIPSTTEDFGSTTKAQVKQLIGYNRKLIREFIEFLSNEIKKSPFWDGKNRIASA
jgi:glycine cleavage system regulatory protein